MDLLPVPAHMRSLQVAVSERHLAGIAGILIQLGRGGSRNRLWPMRRRPTRRDCGHVENGEEKGQGRSGDEV